MRGGQMRSSSTPPPTAQKIPVQLTGEKDAAGTQAATRVDTGEPLLDAAGQPLRLIGSDARLPSSTRLRSAAR